MKHVGRFDVAMPHAAIVRVLQRLKKLRQDVDHLCNAEGSLLLEALSQAATLDVLHRDIGKGSFFAVLIHGDDAWMGEAACRLCLDTESRREILVVVIEQQVTADGLERHGTLDVRIDRLIDDAHRAFADHAQ